MPITFADCRCSTRFAKDTSKMIPVGTGWKSRVAACSRSFARSSPAWVSSAVAALSVIHPRPPSTAPLGLFVLVRPPAVVRHGVAVEQRRLGRRRGRVVDEYEQDFALDV